MSKRDRSQSKLSAKVISPNSNKHKKQNNEKNASFYTSVEVSQQQPRLLQAFLNGYDCLHQNNKEIWKNVCQWSNDFSKLNNQICQKFADKGLKIKDHTFLLERLAIQMFQQSLCKIPLKIIDQIRSIEDFNKKKLQTLQIYLQQLQSLLQKQKKELFGSNLVVSDNFKERTLQPHKEEIRNIEKQIYECKFNIDKLLRFQSTNKANTEGLKLVTVHQAYSNIWVEQNQSRNCFTWTTENQNRDKRYKLSINSLTLSINLSKLSH